MSCRAANTGKTYDVSAGSGKLCHHEHAGNSTARRHRAGQGFRALLGIRSGCAEAEGSLASPTYSWRWASSSSWMAAICQRSKSVIRPSRRSSPAEVDGLAGDGSVRRVFHNVLAVSGQVDRRLPLCVTHRDPAAQGLLHLPEVVNQGGGLVHRWRFASSASLGRLTSCTACRPGHLAGILVA